MVTLEQVQAARKRVRDAIMTTPCVPCANLSDRCQAELWFKLESLQHTGSFKARGAINRLLQLRSKGRRGGVLAFSAGNHAQGVAWAASKVGVEALVVMPRTTPLVKVSRTRELGAEVERFGDTFSEAAQRAEELRASGEHEFIHPFDDPEVIAGQGTAGMEILEQVPDLEAVVCPIGGGGLISGVALTIKAMRPEVSVLGVQTQTAPSMRESLAAGHVVARPTGPTIADGIAVKKPAALTLEIVRRFVDDIALVSETEVEEAVYELLSSGRLLSEGAGAATYAAVRAGRFPQLRGRRVVVVLSGGNIDLNVLGRLIERSQVREGRLARLSVSVGDRPGALARLLALVGDAEANVIRVQHERSFSQRDLWQVVIELVLETRDRGHVAEIVRTLESAGYESVRDLGPTSLPVAGT